MGCANLIAVAGSGRRTILRQVDNLSTMLLCPWRTRFSFELVGRFPRSTPVKVKQAKPPVAPVAIEARGGEPRARRSVSALDSGPVSGLRFREVAALV